ncbi:sel1 repeat family protein [Streptomyces sp. NPDC127168]|uniref:sel1 repeat family protein n=1 Tax=unclassified Streptomyces TaxID=2593676 RepID=UPI00363C4873
MSSAKGPVAHRGGWEKGGHSVPEPAVSNGEAISVAQCLDGMDLGTALKLVDDFREGPMGGIPSLRDISPEGRKSPTVPNYRTISAWFNGTNLPSNPAQLLHVVGYIRSAADERGLLDAVVDEDCGLTARDLLHETWWSDKWETEQRRKKEAAATGVRAQQGAAALERARQAQRLAQLADRCRPVGEWTARRLRVHTAISGKHRPYRGRAQRAGGAAASMANDIILPTYVPRLHDAELRRHLTAAVAVEAAPQLLLVMGDSCTGKTRAAYEAIKDIVPGEFQLLFPTDAKSLLGVLEADALPAGTVLWLNEMQNYLDNELGEAVAAALLRRLDGSGPLPVLATLWTHLDPTRIMDRNSRVTDLLAQAVRIHVPKDFSDDLQVARTTAQEADDASLDEALATGSSLLTQTLAAGPDLVEVYEHPQRLPGEWAKALISVGMDAHRLGHIDILPTACLEAAAPGYLSDRERSAADLNWFSRALAEAQTLVKDTSAPLQDVPNSFGMGRRPDVVQLADYLRQYGRYTRRLVSPPGSFWEAFTDARISPLALNKLAASAWARCRYRQAARLYAMAAAADQRPPLRISTSRPVKTVRNSKRLHAMSRMAAKASTGLHSYEPAGREVALTSLAMMAEDLEDVAAADRYAWLAACRGEYLALWSLADRRKMQDEDGTSVLIMFQALRDSGNTSVLPFQAAAQLMFGDRAGAASTYRSAVDASFATQLQKQRLEALRAAGREEDIDSIRGMADVVPATDDILDQYIAASIAWAYRNFSLAESLAYQAAKFEDEEWVKRTRYLPKVESGAKSPPLENAWETPVQKIQQEENDEQRAIHRYRELARKGDREALTLLARRAENEQEWRELEQIAIAADETTTRYCLKALACASQEPRRTRFFLTSLEYHAAGQVHTTAWDPLLGDDLSDWAAALQEEGRAEEAAHMLRYGLEADGSVASPWTWPEVDPGTPDPPGL